MAFLEETLSFFFFIFFHAGAHKLHKLAFSMGTERYRRGQSTFETAFRKSNCSLALPCLVLPCCALLRQGDSTSLDIPRATRINAANGERAIAICVSNGHPRVAVRRRTLINVLDFENPRSILDRRSRAPTRNPTSLLRGLAEIAQLATYAPLALAISTTFHVP